MIGRAAKLRLIVGVQIRGGWRWAVTHLYALLILAPIVLGLTYYSATQWAKSAEGWRPSGAIGALIALAAAAGLIGASLSRASQEIYHLRRPESFLDHLPVDSVTQFHAVFVARFARTLFAVAALLVLIAVLRDDWARVETLFVCLLLATITALSEIFGALNWVHWTHAKNGKIALAATSVVSIGVAVNAWLVIAVVRPEALSDRFRFSLLMCAIVAAWALVLYSLSRFAYQRWRAADLEFAKRLPSSSGRRRRGATSGVIARRLKLSDAVRAQINRDLRLTRRVFSSIIYAGAGLAALEIVALVAALSTNALTPGAFGVQDTTATSWLPSVLAVKMICVAATVSLGALLLPALINHQSSRLWVERAYGTIGADLWLAKVWYARIVTLPIPTLVWLISLAGGAAPIAYAPLLLAECLWVWWIVSTLVGSLAYEMPGEPLLAAIVMIIVGIAAGALTGLFWPIGLAIYAFGIQSLTARGHARANYHLLGIEN